MLFSFTNAHSDTFGLPFSSIYYSFQGQERHHKPKNVTLILLHSSQIKYA